MDFKILGLGSALPQRVVSNEEIERCTGLGADKIFSTFGIEQRRWSRRLDCANPAPNDTCSSLSARAGAMAVESAGLQNTQIDALVCASMTPDFVSPPLDAVVAEKLGLRSLLAASIHAPCTSLFRALTVAHGWLATNRATTVLVTVAETISPFFRLQPDSPEDHKLSSALFADGAGALVVGRSLGGYGEACGLFSEIRRRDDRPGVYSPGLMSALPPDRSNAESNEHLGYHDFRRVLRHGSVLVRESIDRVLERCEFGMEDVDHFVMHQATGSLRRHAERVGVPSDKVAVNINHVGNTVGASVPILLDELHRQGEIASGDILVLHAAESASWGYGGFALKWL